MRSRCVKLSGSASNPLKASWEIFLYRLSSAVNDGGIGRVGVVDMDGDLQNIRSLFKGINCSACWKGAKWFTTVEAKRNRPAARAMRTSNSGRSFKVGRL